MITDPRAPSFFILGAAKSGTTSLYQFLRAHPQVYLPASKETHFFSSDSYEADGLEKYLSDYFRGSEGFAARGEATPAYFHLGDLVAPRMLAVLGPQTRFILILRDPVRRAWSHYLHTQRLGMEDRPFAEIVAARESETLEDRIRWRAYYTEGLYARQLRTWHEYFAPERFVVFLTDDLARDAAAVAARCFQFLGVDQDVEVTTTHRSNVARGTRFRLLARATNRPVPTSIGWLVPARIRARVRSAINAWNRRPLPGETNLGRREEDTLRRSYSEDVRELQDLIGRDLSHWLPPSP